MKKLLTLIAFAAPVLAAQAQNTDSASAAAAAAMANATPVHKLKTNDQVLPRWAFDLGFRYGLLTQNLEMAGLEQAYGTNSLGTSKYVQPTFSNGSGIGGEVYLNYFFNRKRTLGVGIGVQYMHYVGELKMDTMYADFQAVDSKKNIYRQIIRTVGPLTEDVKIDNLNVPVLLRFKHQFGRSYKPSSFGITADIGPVFGLYNQTQADANGRFSYEAIYKLNQVNGQIVSGFETNPTSSTGNALVITQAEYSRPDQNATKELDNFFAKDGFNVGLNKSIAPGQRSQTGNYNAISFGGMAQLGITYQLSYHVTFMLGGYFMYQSYSNNNNDTYRPVTKLEDVGGTSYSDYRPLTSGAKKSDYTSYGLNAGFRIFFGEKRDVDGDGIPDAVDRCKLEYGEARFNGCPDRDHDGIADAEDACPDEPGGEGTNGCPDDDQDGVPNKLDACPTTFGELRNGCPVSEAVKYAQVDTTRTTRVENGTFLPPHIVLETDVLYFDYGRSDIQDSTAKVLDYALRVLDKEPKVVIYISGYTDDIGNEKSNLFLSYQRAKSAKNYFIKKGIDSKRIIIGSYGMDSPAVPNNTPQGKAKNRRIEMKLLLPL